MKKCLACDRTYDDAQVFCLDDGTPLIADETATNSETTVVLSQKRSKLPFIFVGLLLLVGASVGAFLFYPSRNDPSQDNKQMAVNIQQTPVPTPNLTPIPTPNAEPTPAATPEVNSNVLTNTNVSTNAEIVSNTKPSEETNSAKQQASALKVEDHSVVFDLRQCRKSGTAITCDFLFTNKGQDRRFEIVARKSNLYDELGNGYNGKNAQLANQTGSEPRIGFICGATAKAQIAFEGIEPNANKVTLLQYNTMSLTITA